MSWKLKQGAIRICSFIHGYTGTPVLQNADAGIEFILAELIATVTPADVAAAKKHLQEIERQAAALSKRFADGRD